ncbi:Smr domain-containing protein [Kluyveromyces lactis]|uniref:KLLA0D03388p n=1 Tax=Kluyveromyces lactis (strain ATCC 8585 / CBS 2359 / DSM 70799 / NBRC 1267 / NRRL Y-1140 / WM37) TaxID=284590 RepID=Q6CS72_KLULA|nr:uncharacterized protein KLLA0_D03388g [Kluyveromyces lactis]CAH00313.1 KLLA0D03388p [Kluyveromyces lactis]|eukprot:XP_453217.1 uncharacterized protein KLLA0_D03388g [Kluyveromyces lactis]
MSYVAERGALLSTEKDYNHATDKEYQRLRGLADQAYKERQKLSQQSQSSFKTGDKSKAHELSEAAKKKLKEAEDYNLQAAEYVFVANNADSSSNEIDLHGLYVKEAKWILQRRVAAAVKNGESELQVIVGKGLHSSNGVAKLKPAIQELCDEANLNDHVDSKNTGVVIIDLTGARIPVSWDTTDFSTYSQSQANKPSKPQQAYQGQQQPQYQPYAQQQQHQQQQSSGSSSLVDQLLRMLCQCVKNNM